MGEKRLEPLYLKGDATSEQRMIEEFFQGVKTYVDERLDEEFAKRPLVERNNDTAEVMSRFTAKAVNEEGMRQINASRDAVFNLAIVWMNLIPAGRERAQAFTALEQASFHATAAISRQKGNQS